ncbi:MAG: hypothetical protein IJ105_05930 [Bacilli bacterium]|nr:hypothetical protein [Bacilli bacterium]
MQRFCYARYKNDLYKEFLEKYNYKDDYLSSIIGVYYNKDGSVTFTGIINSIIPEYEVTKNYSFGEEMGSYKIFKGYNNYRMICIYDDENEYMQDVLTNEKYKLSSDTGELCFEPVQSFFLKRNDAINEKSKILLNEYKDEIIENYKQSIESLREFSKNTARTCAQHIRQEQHNDYLKKLELIKSNDPISDEMIYR